MVVGRGRGSWVRIDEEGREEGDDKGPARRGRSRAENIVGMRRTSEGWGCMLIERF